MCTCVTEKAFAWVSAVVVNIAFVSLIAWGANTAWYIGFILLAIYTLILFGLARFIDGKSGWDRSGDIAPEVLAGDIECSGEALDGFESEAVAVAVPATTIEGDHPNPPPPLHRMPSLPNLLYGLFSLALGVTGYFLPMNLYACYEFGTGNASQSGRWSTDLLSLPANVQDWAKATLSFNPNPTFAFLSGERNATLFQGTDKTDSNPTLWIVSGSDEPINSPEMQNLLQFILTGSGFACFSAYGDDTSHSGDDDTSHSDDMYETKAVVGCSDGTKVTTTSLWYDFIQSPHDFYVDGTVRLWFKDSRWYYGQAGEGAVIYSIGNFTSMELELHSTYTYTDNYIEDAATRPENCFREQSTVAIFVSALPIILSSVLFWIKRSAPSSAITTYIGTSAMAFFAYVAAVEEFYNVEDFWGYWLSVSGAFYVLILADLTHCQRPIAKPPLVWGMNFGSLAFFVGMIISTKIYELENAVPWILFNLFAILPLALLGVAYNQVFLLVLCAIGWIMTTVRIASAISDALFNAAEVPIYFIVLAISGLLIAAAGWGLNKHQDGMCGALGGRLERISLSRRIFPGVELQSGAISTDQH